jgi:tetratricopeptide (TPR) repeat protein
MYVVCLAAVVACAVAIASASSNATKLRQSPKSNDAQLSGTWRVSLHETDGVEIDFRMTFAVNGTQRLRWEAYTRPGAAREMVGGGTAILGHLLGKMPPREALIYIGDGARERHGDSISLKGALESPFLGRRNFTGVLTLQAIHADLVRSSSGVKAGTMDGGESYEALKRPADAERAYRRALRIADQQRPIPSPVWHASVHKRLAGILTAKGDREGALHEYIEVLKLVPDDAEALAAVRARRGN